MTSRVIFLATFALLAAGAAVTFLAISVAPDIYAPGASHLELPGWLRDALASVLPERFEGDLTSRRILRKIYSVVSFALVAFFAAPLFARRERIAAATLAGTGISLAIEVVQRATVSHESYLSSAFDLGCGALGGVIGGGAWNAVADRAVKRPPPPRPPAARETFRRRR